MVRRMLLVMLLSWCRGRDLNPDDLSVSGV
jgi:hypothetical protein